MKFLRFIDKNFVYSLFPSHKKSIEKKKCKKRVCQHKSDKRICSTLNSAMEIVDSQESAVLNKPAGTDRSDNRRVVSFENLFLVWLDSVIGESDENVSKFITELQHTIYSVKLFTDSDQCVDFITNIENEKIFMIMSGTYSEELLSIIDDLIGVDSIYIFDNRNSIDQQWVPECKKVRGIFTRIESICKALKIDIYRFNNNLIPLSILTTISSTNLNELDPSFMYSQLLKETLFDMPNGEEAKQAFIEFCRTQYADNSKRMETIDEFEEYYSEPTPIFWYTRGTFFYE